MFDKLQNMIEDFLENTPEDIFEFSIILEDMLCDDYDALYAEQPEATKILEKKVPDICATGEPGMEPEEIEKFKKDLRAEYEKALKAIR